MEQQKAKLIEVNLNVPLYMIITYEQIHFLTQELTYNPRRSPDQRWWGHELFRSLNRRHHKRDICPRQRLNQEFDHIQRAAAHATLVKRSGNVARRMNEVTPR